MNQHVKSKRGRANKGRKAATGTRGTGGCLNFRKVRGRAVDSTFPPLPSLSLRTLSPRVLRELRLLLTELAMYRRGRP